MRLLATRHIFEEVSPDTFRNTRLSSALCIGKPVHEMLQKLVIHLGLYPRLIPLRSPTNRWDGTDGVAAMTALE